ncbi:type II/IV secretion system protein [Candidatus Falkowbacteria bacterium]|jgi:type IV pilus assembly protein PilB|nr:type II/IV secretion system protein [Candidatus Falkowbacteria bacterium]MBT5503089.1 type II/IV secretion system protein [Candidatus Falkowbacteria bacterium]MBT6574183.1 type II/IV secretion system protein [Candidatus Falkowbacteria bacterium]MBT7348670.1 type II/IV secretion system protein [Candidatus Falkowbacteria bacterium]MBT7500460.1 type II/IV secretion system protein [Candidatus Falkowbacteria bacterium]
MSKATSSIEDLLSGGSQSKLTGKKASPTASDDDNDNKKDPTKPKVIKPATTEDRLKNKLKKLGFSDKEKAVQKKANELNVPYIDLTEFPISSEALRLIPETVCKKEKVVAFVATGEQIRLATTNSTNPEITKIANSLQEAQNAKVETYLFSERNLKHALELYAKLPKYKPAVKGVEITEEELEKFKEIGKNFKDLDEHLRKVSMTEMVSMIIAAGVQAGSSDIHIEAEEDAVKVRFRVDGILHETASIDVKIWPKVISRIKLLAGLKMNITAKPQDGRFTIHSKEQDIDVRTSTLPTTWGESVVMRLLKSSSISLGFEDLGITGKSFENLKFQVERPNGMIVTTGPTGSGKTTTLYAILNKLNLEGVKIITLEDPVEYKLAGINQSQIDHSKGYSFADGLRSILRQDPDIVMVGEMRDLETADVAINAALTGHMVISTIHTNSAAGAVPRFLSMGVKPFLLAPALNAIMGQRLVRRVCEKCKEEDPIDEKKLARVKEIIEVIPEDHPDRPDLTKLKFFKGKGCDACNNLGYKGRIGIYEIMAMTPEIEKVILGGKVSEYDMLQIAIKNGMITMVQDGIIKALAGITSVEEVFRVSE